MKMVQIGKTPNGYVVVDARLAPRDTASVAPVFAVGSEHQLRSALAGFGFTREIIDKAVQEVNTTGQADIPFGT
jgi:hypothetical protein